MIRKPKIQCGNDDSQPRLMARALWGQCNLPRTVAIQCIPIKLLNRSRNSVFNVYSNQKKHTKGSIYLSALYCGIVGILILALTPMVDPHFASHLTRGSNPDANIMIPMKSHETSSCWVSNQYDCWNIGCIISHLGLSENRVYSQL